MGYPWFGLWAPCLCFLLSSPAFAFTPTVSSNGVSVHWTGTPRLALAGNPTNRSGIDPQSFFDAVVHGLQRWQAASMGTVAFDYWQGTDPSVYEPNSEFNGLSSIYFASNASSNPGLSANVLGLTQVWYDTANGRILEADVVLNDLNYRFTTNPRDTSGYGNGSSSGRDVYIENVITHELGHTLGLSHSGGLQTTMLFMESPEQAYLGCDEQSGIRALYRGSASDGAGSIIGTVLAEENHTPIFGTQVQAISRTHGTTLSAAITDHQGRYSLGQLPPGSYYLMVEPFYAGSSALPGYYSGLSSGVCAGGVTFGRSFLVDPANLNSAIAVAVAGGQLTAAPDLIARCSRGETASAVHSISGGIVAAVPSLSSSGGGSANSRIFEGSTGGFGVVDRFDSSSLVRSFLLKKVSGRIQLNALGYSLYSPISLDIRLLQANGMPVPSAKPVAPIFSSRSSGYINHDAALVAEDLPLGDYLVQVSGTRLGTSEYPAGPISIDSVPFFLLTGSINEEREGLDQVSFNARCSMKESFPAYVSPPGPPERHSVDGDSKLGFCGSLERPGDDIPRTGASASEIVGWCLPWFFMLAMLRVHRLTANLEG